MKRVPDGGKAAEPVIVDFIANTPDGDKYVKKINELIKEYSN